jgi:DNA primase
VRPVAGAPVSMPLVWEDIVPQPDARQSHLRDALEPEASWAGDPRLPVLTESRSRRCARQAGGVRERR